MSKGQTKEPIAANTTYPGGSKSRVNRAGESVRSNMLTHEDLEVIEAWRAAHRAVLNTFQAVLRGRTRGKGVIVAQRHKRKNTIFDKLVRLPGMQLARMDDVAGCRLIFKDIKDLIIFRKDFHKARFNHKMRNPPEKYDYIARPKNTGYRGIHDIYEYDVNSKFGEGLKGLYIEIQYRTLVQHAWATAVEVVGFITESQPKFEKGDERYNRAMAYASEILARAHEDSKGPFPSLSDREVLEEFLELDESLNLMPTLRGLHQAKSDISDKKNSILIFSPEGKLTVKSYRDATDALRELFNFEKEMPENDIVLVRADSSEEVRTAFRNYFNDASEFVKLMDSGYARLSGKN
ncbi:RelA/SpoT domain-containing protein [Xanthomonas campestris]|uniref:RelA/SpoT domain-containing protein n=1 Tax=Xanthomonas campestris TaxID=339 RepID=UPI001C407BF8|nr:RelA/SpoT domain-containing protein [Xanthomonas campestris]MEB1152616.1 RelA/SpoT domain-containing protein [Xanthomonas campestris pv. campestris]MCC5098712.1 RelA/SpoT domain-containing protein [Xanthomonas campestris]MEA9583665.1 RelA/SpoT domain-containing protein [Xanthomonas campestris]MEA9592751.1 RelA/SpoT domain-containing protein [Xanthomonas campestris]MEA9623759.1 RelA/SpoT domain-containing protein [Xanthomonas campestris]